MIKTATKRVGITGGIGSGKSTVARIFELLGIPIYSADSRAKWLMAHDENLKTQIISQFGEEAFLEDGSLNRPYLSEKVFSDPEKIKAINRLVHPAVSRDFDSWANAQTTPYVLKEAALIFETEGDKILDAVINVSSPLKIRVGRVMMRDPHRSEKQLQEIITQQLPDEEKNKRADFVIKNTDNKLLIPQVLEVHKKILSSG